MVTAQEPELGRADLPPAKHRAGNDAHFALIQLARHQFIEIGSEAGPQQPRILDARTAQRNDALHIKPPGAKQFADGDQILVVEMPDGLLVAHRIEQMNVCPRQAGRMRTVELLHSHRLDVTAG